MNRGLLGFLVAMAFAAAPSLAAEPALKTDITVSGYGSVTLEPNVANVSAAVETNAPGAAEAVEHNNTRYDAIVTALEKIGISRADITLSYYNVSYTPQPRTLPPQPSGEQYGYTVSRGFNVKVRDITKAGRVVDACTHAGATSVNGVSFGVADSSAARMAATRKAVDDARATAQALADAAHLRVTSIKSMDLGGAGVPGPVPMMRVAASIAPTQFDQSNVTISVSISVTFVAEP